MTEMKTEISTKEVTKEISIDKKVNEATIRTKTLIAEVIIIAEINVEIMITSSMINAVIETLTKRINPNKNQSLKVSIVNLSGYLRSTKSLRYDKDV